LFNGVLRYFLNHLGNFTMVCFIGGGSHRPAVSNLQTLSHTAKK
jgi:hypothetical protein